MEDTIAAIATALGVGAISIIRVSGPNSISIVNEIWKGKNLIKQKTHTIHYGYIIDNDQIIDEVLITIMKAPKTFTCEDVVEINCHGGIATTNQILELLLTHGCRLATPGEFSKRAFLNGRIDLIEAEGIMDVIASKTDKSLKLAMNQLSGKSSTMIHDFRKTIVEILANIEVNIDYPEYEDIEEMTIEQLSYLVTILKEKMTQILEESKNGKLIKEGISTVIIGKPNVGKSSLLNALLEEDKAIVTEIEGTTRDIIEGQIHLGGIILNMIDTAGIRETNDIVEKIGVEKSLKLIEQADLILFMINQNEIFDQKDQILLEKIKEKPHITILNKIDLESKIKIENINDDFIIDMSLTEKKGIENLKKQIQILFQLGSLQTEDMTYLTSARSISLLKQAVNALDEVEKGLEVHQSIDMIEIDLKNCWEILGEIIGETYQDELIDQLFSQFCLGK